MTHWGGEGGTREPQRGEGGEGECVCGAESRGVTAGEHPDDSDRHTHRRAHREAGAHGCAHTGAALLLLGGSTPELGVGELFTRSLCLPSPPPKAPPAPGCRPPLLSPSPSLWGQRPWETGSESCSEMGWSVCHPFCTRGELNPALAKGGLIPDRVPGRALGAHLPGSSLEAPHHHTEPVSHGHAKVTEPQ